MLKYPIILLMCFIVLLICFTSCGHSSNSENTIVWIREHKKPIVCNLYGRNDLGEVIYTLLDAEGNIYNTGRVKLALPDTIQIINLK